jgi:hypothetical protein
MSVLSVRERAQGPWQGISGGPALLRHPASPAATPRQGGFGGQVRRPADRPRSQSPFYSKKFRVRCPPAADKNHTLLLTCPAFTKAAQGVLDVPGRQQRPKPLQRQPMRATPWIAIGRALRNGGAEDQVPRGLRPSISKHPGAGGKTRVEPSAGGRISLRLTLVDNPTSLPCFTKASYAAEASKDMMQGEKATKDASGHQ